MDICQRSGIEEISNYAVRLQNKGNKEARDNVDKLMAFYASLGCKFATNEKVISKAKYCVTCYRRQCIRVVIEKDEFHITKDEFYITNEEYFSKQGIKVLNIDEYMELITKLSNKQIMMKKTIEIECPDGQKAVWNNGKVEFVPIDHIDNIKTFEAAIEYIKDNGMYGDLIYEYNMTPRDSYSEKLCKYRIVVAALTNNEERKLTTGERWYPVVQVCYPDSVRNCFGKEIIGKIAHNGEKFVAVGGGAAIGGLAGLGCFDSGHGVGIAASAVGFRSVSSKKVAEHISKYFGKLLFEVHYGGCNCKWEWVE